MTKTQRLQVGEIVKYPRWQSNQPVVIKIQHLQIGKAVKVVCSQRNGCCVGYDQRSDSAELGKVGNLIVLSDTGP